MRSLVPLVAFKTAEPDFKTPEYSRKKGEMSHVGVAQKFEGQDREGRRPSVAGRSTISPLGSTPLTGGLSSGEGR